MNKLSYLTIFITIIATFYHAPTVKGDEEDIVFSKVAEELPLGLSDMTATYIADFKGQGAEAIILTGGCSDEFGNSEVIEEKDGKNITNYYCNTISKATYVFYPSTFNIEPLADMPYERYRHSAAYVDGKLYVIGGRTFNFEVFDFDELVTEILVYDPMDGDNGSWSSFYDLGDAATSDQASFGKGGDIYIIGGYKATYETVDTAFKLNVETKNIVNLDSMNTKRGDANAVYYNAGGIEAIYIMGGFSAETSIEFCEPLYDAEKYDFSTNKWTPIAPLKNQRGDKGVVVLNERILAIGGEDKHEALCAGDEDIDPFSHAVAVDDVESYHPQDGDDAEWEVEADFQEFRFRFAAAVAEEIDTVFVFGGQLAYDVECKCYKTSKDIFRYRETHTHPHDNGATTGSGITVIAATLVALATAFLL